MRRFFLIFSLLLAPSLFAQVRVSAYASDVFETDAKGFGAALEYRFQPRWAAEVAVASETHTISNFLSFTERDVRTRPIDLMVHYYFVNQTRWEPFLGAGVRHVTSSDDAIDDQTSAEIDGGFHFMVTPSFSIRVDGRVPFEDNDTISFGPALKLSAGVGWKF
ncbi:MAG TPA: OmpW family outer membrane protein [Thermoanaerobaculia bacterium]|nr:OmpW family outer membrane protein [Thermoanaerobaculia bacterium]